MEEAFGSSKRGRVIGELELPGTSQEIKHILVFGSWIVGCGSQRCRSMEERLLRALYHNRTA